MQYEARLTVIALQSTNYKLLSKGVSRHILYTKLFAEYTEKESKIKWPRERTEEANGQQKPKNGSTFQLNYIHIEIVDGLKTMKCYYILLRRKVVH